MKRVLYGIFSLIILLVLTNCEGDEGQPGPAGPQGPQGLQGIEGPQGPIGVDGNANVRQYTFGAFDFSTGGFAQLTVSTTLDTMNRSAWHTYLLYAPINRWYLVPGLGPGGTTNYRISMGHFGGKVNIILIRLVPENPFLKYELSEYTQILLCPEEEKNNSLI